MVTVQNIKTALIRFLGEKPAAFIHGLRFVYLLHSGRSIDPEIALLPKLLRRGDVAVDVGANGANWTYWLHRAVGGDGFVLAFEADPYYALATQFAARFLMLRGVKIEPYGLSDSDEDVPLRVTDSDGMVLTGLSHVDRTADRNHKNVRVVRLLRLDSLRQQYPELQRCTLIKCDVEGYELFVFRGARSVLEHSRPVVILETGNFELQGYSGKEMSDFFTSMAYRSFALIGEDTLEQTGAAMEHDRALSVNRVLIPEERIPGIRDRIRVLG